MVWASTVRVEIASKATDVMQPRRFLKVRTEFIFGIENKTADRPRRGSDTERKTGPETELILAGFISAYLKDPVPDLQWIEGGK